MSRLLAVFALILIGGVFIFFAQFDNISTLSISQITPEWVEKKFAYGETIAILERPQFFPELIADVTAYTDLNVFNVDEIPDEYKDLALQQANEIENYLKGLGVNLDIFPNGKIPFEVRNLAAEQKALENPEPERSVEGELRIAQVVAKTDQHVEGDGLEAKLVTTGIVASVFTRGEPVPVVGKINVPNLTGPYFYSITVYCCNQDKPMLNKGHVSTDGQGNFIYTIYTNNNFPIGVYDVVVSTLSADLRKDIDYKWQFDLS